MNQYNAHDSFLRMLIKRDREKPPFVRTYQWFYLLAAASVCYVIPPSPELWKYFFVGTTFILFFPPLLGIFIAHMLFTKNSMRIAKWLTLFLFASTFYIFQWFYVNLVFEIFFGTGIWELNTKAITEGLTRIHTLSFVKLTDYAAGGMLFGVLFALLFFAPTIISYLLVSHSQKAQKLLEEKQAAFSKFKAITE